MTINPIVFGSTDIISVEQMFGRKNTAPLSWRSVGNDSALIGSASLLVRCMVSICLSKHPYKTHSGIIGGGRDAEDI